MRIYQTGLEMNSLPLEGFAVTGSNMAAQSSVVAPGGSVYSMRSNPTAAASRAAIQYATGSQPEQFFKFKYRVATHPANGIAVLNITDGGSTVFPVRIQSTGSGLKFVGDGTAGSPQFGSNQSLNTNQWYLIELRVVSNATTGIVTVKIDGTQAINVTGVNTTGNDMQFFIFGTSTSDTHDWYIDDVAVNDTASGIQDTFIGNETIITKRANAAGDSNGFLVQVGGTVGSANNFTRINELTPDDATSYNASAILNAEDLFNFTDSGINALDTVTVVSVGARYANITTADATSAIKLELEKAAAGTKLQSAAIIPNSTTWNTNGTVKADRIHAALDPDGGAWTKTTVDSLQAGYKITTAGVNAIGISDLWVNIALIPFLPTAGGTLPMMGV